MLRSASLRFTISIFFLIHRIAGPTTTQSPPNHIWLKVMFHFWSQPFSCKCWNTELLKVLLAVVVVHWSLTQISVPVWHRNLSESSLSRTHQGGDGQGASQRSWHSPRALCQNIMANDGHHERWKWKRLGRGPNKWSLTSGLCQFLFQLVPHWSLSCCKP